MPELDSAIDAFEREWGVRPAFGGRHVGRGTHNALVSFGTSYLELIAPDPTQPEPNAARPFGIDDLDDARFVTFAVRPDAHRGETLDSLVGACVDVDHDPGAVVEMSRRTPDGHLLEWRLTFPTMTHDGLIPFLIDWGSTAHPAASAPVGVSLGSLSGRTTDPARANAVLRALGLSEFAAGTDQGPPGLAAELRSSRPPTEREGGE